MPSELEKASLPDHGDPPWELRDHQQDMLMPTCHLQCRCCRGGLGTVSTAGFWAWRGSVYVYVPSEPERAGLPDHGGPPWELQGCHQHLHVPACHVQWKSCRDSPFCFQIGVPSLRYVAMVQSPHRLPLLINLSSRHGTLQLFTRKQAMVVDLNFTCAWRTLWVRYRRRTRWQ